MIDLGFDVFHRNGKCVGPCLEGEEKKVLSLWDDVQEEPDGDEEGGGEESEEYFQTEWLSERWPECRQHCCRYCCLQVCEILIDFDKEIKQLSNLHIFMIGRREFTRFDQNGDGEIDIDEFGKFLRSICLYLTSFFPVPWWCNCL